MTPIKSLGLGLFEIVESYSDGFVRFPQLIKATSIFIFAATLKNKLFTSQLRGLVE